MRLVLAPDEARRSPSATRRKCRKLQRGDRTRLAPSEHAVYDRAVSRRRGALALSLLLLVPGVAVATAAMSACGSFGASGDPPAGGDDASPEGSAGEGSTGADGGPTADGARSDAACSGAFGSARTIALGSGLGGSVRSVRGGPNGIFLVSWAASSDDDNMATATIQSGSLTLTAANTLGPLNLSSQENQPTGSADLGFVVFASNRAVTDGAPAVSLLWISDFDGTSYASAKYLPVSNVALGLSIANPYLVNDQQIFFDVQGQLRVGLLTRSNNTVPQIADVPGLGAGTHPVVTTDRREIFFQSATGVSFASRGDAKDQFKVQTPLLGSMGDYPTWISTDACHLYVLHATVSGRELQIYDREP